MSFFFKLFGKKKSVAEAPKNEFQKPSAPKAFNEVNAVLETTTKQADEAITPLCKQEKLLETEQDSLKVQEEHKSTIEPAPVQNESSVPIALQMKQYDFTIDDVPIVDIVLSDLKIENRLASEMAEIKFSNITAKGKYPEFVVIDTETTGLHSGRDKIVEIAAIRFVDGRPTEMFKSFVNPQKKKLNPEAMAVNHITEEDLKDAPTIKQILPAFDAFIGKSDIVGHNLSFDLGFIHHAGSTICDTKRRYFCTLEQSRKMFKTPKKKWDKEFECYEIDYFSDYDVENHKLGTMCDYCGIEIPIQHRAYGDAYATGLLFLELVDHKRALAELKNR